MKMKIREGMVLTAEQVLENELQIISQEEYNKLKNDADNKFQKFLDVEEWRKYIEWKPIQTDYYALNIDENKFKVYAIKTYSNNIANICHNQSNLDALFTYHPFLNSFKYNEFTQKNEFNGKRYDEDKQPSEIFNFFKRNFGEWCPRIDIKETIQETLNRNTYHPIKNYIESLIWDGQPHLETFLNKYYGVEDNKLNRVYFTRWMIAMIKRIYYPGAKFDSMLILAGEQGKKKTTLFTWLGTINGNKYWSEVPDNIKDINNVIYSSLGKYLMTFDDFDDICNKGDLGKVKSFVTNTSSTAALKWQHDKDFNVNYVLAASTNQYDMLVDDSSFDERRFWIIRVNPSNDTFDIPDEEKEQLFAEAYFKFREDENQKLWIWEPELKADERELQKEFKKAGSDPAIEKIMDIFNRKYPIKDGMFENEEHFLRCLKQNNNDNDFNEFTSVFSENNLQYIRIIPSAWIINYIGKEGYNRGTDRIIQILYNQGLDVKKKTRYHIYDKQLTVISINR